MVRFAYLSFLGLCLTSTAAISLSLDGRQTAPPTIKKIAGSFSYVGCFTDAVNGAARTLSQQVMGGGATAETCTSACAANGFPLAGLEFGGECWCNSYASRADIVPDTDCNSVCDADHTELCGARNRLAIYQDSSAAPLDAGTCLLNGFITPDSNTNYKFTFEMIPSSGGGNPVPLALVPNGDPVTAAGGFSQQFFQLSGRPFVPTTLTPKQPITFGFGLSFFLDPDQVATAPIKPIQLVAGSPIQFEATEDIRVPEFQGYCAMPNPLSVLGLRFGPPLLGTSRIGIAGQSNVWSSCQSSPGALDPIFNAGTPVNVNCTGVFLAMQPA